MLAFFKKTWHNQKRFKQKNKKFFTLMYINKENSIKIERAYEEIYYISSCIVICINQPSIHLGS